MKMWARPWFAKKYEGVALDENMKFFRSERRAAMNLHIEGVIHEFATRILKNTIIMITNFGWLACKLR
ncbi:hypothetical protein GCM10009597_46610 [Peribacillus frigoritolerans]